MKKNGAVSIIKVNSAWFHVRAFVRNSWKTVVISVALAWVARPSRMRPEPSSLSEHA